MIFLILALILGLGISPSFKEMSKNITILNDTCVKSAKVVDNNLVSSNLVKDIDTFYSVPSAEIINYSDMALDTFYCSYSYNATSITGSTNEYRSNDTLNYENGVLSWSFTMAQPSSPNSMNFGYMLKIDGGVPLNFGIRCNKYQNTLNLSYRFLDSEFASLSNGTISTWSQNNYSSGGVSTPIYKCNANTMNVVSPSTAQYIFLSYTFITYPSAIYVGDIVIDEFFVSIDGNKGYEPYYAHIPLDLVEEYNQLKSDYDILLKKYNDLFAGFNFGESVKVVFGGDFVVNGVSRTLYYEYFDSLIVSQYSSNGNYDIKSIIYYGLSDYFNTDFANITGFVSVQLDMNDSEEYLLTSFPLIVDSDYTLQMDIDYSSHNDSPSSLYNFSVLDGYFNLKNTPLGSNNIYTYNAVYVGGFSLNGYTPSTSDYYNVFDSYKKLNVSFNAIYGTGYNLGYNDGYYSRDDEVSILNKMAEDLQNRYNSLLESYQYLTYQQIYDLGYNAGLNTAESFNESGGILSFFGVIANIPFVILNGLSPALVFNMPLVYALTGLLFVALIVWIIKKFI